MITFILWIGWRLAQDKAIIIIIIAPTSVLPRGHLGSSPSRRSLFPPAHASCSVVMPVTGSGARGPWTVHGAVWARVGGRSTLIVFLVGGAPRSSAFVDTNTLSHREVAAASGGGQPLGRVAELRAQTTKSRRKPAPRVCPLSVFRL